MSECHQVGFFIFGDYFGHLPAASNAAHIPPGVPAVRAGTGFRRGYCRCPGKRNLYLILNLFCTNYWQVNANVLIYIYRKQVTANNRKEQPKMTIEELCDMIPNDHKIKIGWDGVMIDFDRFNLLQLDAFGDYEIERIFAVTNKMIELGIKAQPVKRNR